MLLGVLQRIFPTPDPARAKTLFLLVQLAFAGFILFLVYLATRGKESSFRVREADKKSSGRRRPGVPDPLAEARMRRNEPLSLPGIRIDGEPHETLGIRRDASVAEIQRAYRDLMKRYHPDAVGRPGSREWSDAQKIAEALNQARGEMLKSRETHSQSPKRSGR